MAELQLPRVTAEHIGLAVVVGITIIATMWVSSGYNTMATNRVAEQISLTNRNTAMAITLSVAVASGSDAAKQEILAATCPQMKDLDHNNRRQEETMESTVCEALLKVFRATDDSEKNEMLKDLLESQKKEQ